MQLRITDPTSKMAFIVVGIALVLIVGVAGAIGLGSLPAALYGSLTVAVLVCIAARTFRGAGEPVTPPRAWWRMTARPFAGFVGSGFFLVSAVSASTASGSATVAALVIALDLLAAAAYLHSSFRLVKGRR